MPILYVSSEVQAALLTKVFIPEFSHGFWRNDRPYGHGETWQSVEIIVSQDDRLGPVDFVSPRNYNFLNLDFYSSRVARLLEVAREVKPTSTERSIKKELVELGQIVGGRLTSKEGTAVKLYRGNHRPGTVTVASARSKDAAAALAQSLSQVKEGPVAKKTAVRVKREKIEKPVLAVPQDLGVMITGLGAKVTRADCAAPLPKEDPLGSIPPTAGHALQCAWLASKSEALESEETQ